MSSVVLLVASILTDPPHLRCNLFLSTALPVLPHCYFSFVNTYLPTILAIYIRMLSFLSRSGSCRWLARACWILAAAAVAGTASAFVMMQPRGSRKRHLHRHHYRHYHYNCQNNNIYQLLMAMSGDTEMQKGQSTNDDYSYSPLFSFDRNDTVALFDRIDDTIMGGASTSTLVDVPDAPYAKWLGLCRTTGGGFCGIRTLPFATPLMNLTDTQGFYIICRLASDQEPERRAWKMSTRIQPDRGEQLYQARFTFSQSIPDQWSTVTIPFDEFRLVRGPRALRESPPLHVSGGIYQIGMTMSKFGLGQNVTEVENFREGPFELQIKEIGVYRNSNTTATSNVAAPSAAQQSVIHLPRILSKEEAKKQSSLILKILRPISKLFFTETSQRRKVAMTLLRTRRYHMTRLQAIRFGLKSRAASSGWISSISKLVAILWVDSLRSVAAVTLRVVLLYPIRLVRKLVNAFKGLLAKLKETAAIDTPK
eukprot:scaffold83_cov181-Amphora_coffeaeformis.AAC.15